MMTLSDFLFLQLRLFCILMGVVIGRDAYGWPGAIVGGFCGLLIAGYFARTYDRFVCRRVRKRLAPFSVEELERSLVDLDIAFETPNWLLMELRARGADIEKHLPMVLDWLCSEYAGKRAIGYGALRATFPETARQLGGFNVWAPVEKCREKVERLTTL